MNENYNYGQGIPTGDVRDNTSGDVALLRDTFLNAERDYVRVLLQNEGLRNLIMQANQYGSDVLFKAAQQIVDNVDAGLVPDEQMERTEQQLTVLLAAIQDKTLVKELVLLPDEMTEGMSHGRGGR